MQMSLKAKTAIILDKRRMKLDTSYPVKLRITFERKQKYYSTNFNLKEKNYQRAMYGERLTDDEKKIKRGIQSYENKAIEIIGSLKYFNWQVFEKRYFQNRGTKDLLDFRFTDYIKELRESGRIGTAITYECAQRSLSKFAPNACFSDVTPDFMNKYEKWMVDNENSITTVGIYLRSLRTLFNNAIAEGTLTNEFYPFGKRKYEIPTGNNIKKSLTLNEVALIYYYHPESDSADEMAKDYWLFMYLCNGINVKDMCLLKYNNIKGEVLEFERAKTIRTKRKAEPIRVALSEDAKNIIKKWGQSCKDKNDYIFPVLTKELTPERERQLIKQLTQVINSHMKAIAISLGITNEVTTYVARHSFATILQRSGASTEFISEALGHTNVRTTQNYLAGFEDETKKERLKALTAFKSIPQNEG